MSSKQTPISPRAIEIYDELMITLGAPELVMSNVDSVPLMEEGASPIDNAARMERYEAIFKEAERIIAMRKLGMDINMHDLLKSKKEQVLHKERTEQNFDLEQAEQAFDSLNDK